jgi:hypothetical protein
MHKYITLFFSVSLFLFSCKGDKTPKEIINHDRMTNLLTQVHMVDGRTYGAAQSQDSLSKYSTARFDALFKRFHTDSVQFRKSLQYYSTHPVELQKIYEQVIANLKQKTDSLNKLQHKTDSLNRIKIKKSNALPQ